MGRIDLRIRLLSLAFLAPQTLSNIYFRKVGLNSPVPTVGRKLCNHLLATNRERKVDADIPDMSTRHSFAAAFVRN
jgi:hypothetical protein